MPGTSANASAASDRLAEQARLLDLSNDAIIVRDGADRVKYWNRGAFQLYGYTREEAQGLVTHELLQTEFPEPLELIAARLRQENHWTGELTHTRKDGSRIVVLSRWALVRDRDGNPQGVLETNNDITRQKQIEQALRESEEQLRDLAEGLEAKCGREPGSWSTAIERLWNAPSSFENCGIAWCEPRMRRDGTSRGSCTTVWANILPR